MSVTNKSLVALLIGISVASFASQASAQDQISAHRAVAIEKCTQAANAEYGPSGDTSMRRFNHDAYASCMADQGEAP
jgi:DNA-binding transcriptional regulator YdaS (Cro superfamily)